MSHCNVRNVVIWLGRSVLISCYVQYHDIADVLAGCIDSTTSTTMGGLVPTEVSFIPYQLHLMPISL